jgi:hypothetical protein
MTGGTAGTGGAAGAGAGAAGAGAGAAGAGATAGASAGAGSGAGFAGTTTLLPRLGRLLTDGRMSSASEIVSAATPKTKTISTPRATRNGRRPGSLSSAKNSVPPTAV